MTRDTNGGRGIAKRTVAVLDAVIHQADAGVGVREMAGQLDLSRSATHRILQTLNELRMVRLRADNRYGPGPRILAWAHFLIERDPLLQKARPILEQLAADTAETALLLTYTEPHHYGLVVDKIESHLPVRYTVRTGTRSPLHAGSAGKAILTHLAPDLVESLDREGLTAHTITDPNRLADELALTRERGYATSSGERFAEAAGASAAFFRGGKVAGAFNVTVPMYRLGEGQLGVLGAKVAGAAADLTEALSSGDPVTAVEASARPAEDFLSRLRQRPSASKPTEGRDAVWACIALDLLAQHPSGGVTPDVITDRAGCSRSTAVRILNELLVADVAHEDGHGRFRAGETMLVWSALLRHGADAIRVAALDVLSGLVAEVGESACLVVYRPEQHCVVFEAAETTDEPIQYIIPIPSHAPLHAGAAGKAVLAHADEPGLVLDAVTEATITDPAELGADLAEIRRRGYAVSVGERIAEAAGVAAPFFVDGTIAGAITITIPRHRFDADRAAVLGARVRAATEDLTRLLS
ncbi:IclR family transcriptional regulator [Mycobacterium sp. NAZ190054]|uniref:IclR family transcriptional regulator n=1 Tax=Mycobacterium sp. NAZ190054 TaxID=1747766 RepID=UPI0007927A49|nr:IclR family transcriptional regulator [Mycobacterium sp. NAZ190054]KWX57516.1 hypothetical protein ASJ79_11215 [Mycobacterium sp. NAZ190054]